MKNTKYGKVRRYRASYYRGRSYWLKRLAATLLVALVVFGIGWFIGPLVADFGTSTWYRLKNGKSAPTDTTAVETVTPVDAQSAQAAATATPTPSPAASAEGVWQEVTLAQVATPEAAADTAAQLASQGVAYALVTLKDASGTLYYPATHALAEGSISEDAIADFGPILEAFRQQGVTLAARLEMYRDAGAPYADSSRTAAVHYEDTDYFWLDAAQENGGKPWLNPYSDVANEYLDSVLDEVMALGFRQVVLYSVQYPNTATARCNYGKGAGVADVSQIASIVQGWQQKAQQQGVALWFAYNLTAAAADQTAPCFAGGSLKDLGAENLFVVMPEETENLKIDDLLAAAKEQAAECEHLCVVTDGRAEPASIG